MKLLVCTQKVDKNDPVLGFFHRWLEEFSLHAESILVICLEEGEHQLPGNVRVLSLGKENGVFRLKYLARFYMYIWSFRKDYNSVFVHMNPEYAVLGGLFWRLWGKRVLLWYNHAKGNILARIGIMFSHNALFTSSFAFASRFKKSVSMPVGIDTGTFMRDTNIERVRASILSLGRISPVKNVHILVDALNILDAKGVSFVCTIQGPVPSLDEGYAQKCKKIGAALISKEKLVFEEGVSYEETPNIFNKHETFVNLTESGSFDKTIIEAMACEMAVLTCNESVRGALGEKWIFEKNDSMALAQKLEKALSLSEDESNQIGKGLREYAVQEHSLSALLNKLKQLI